MKYRQKLGRRRSRRSFARGARRVKRINLGRKLARGGYRL